MAAWWLVVETVAADEPLSGALPVYPVKPGLTVVGRGADCDIVLVSSHVSRQHFSLTVDGPQVTVSDLDSGMGLTVDGQRTTTAAVGNDSVIEVAGIRLRLRDTFPKAQRVLSAADAPIGTTAAATAKSDGPAIDPFRDFLDGLRHSGEPKEVLERTLRGLVDFVAAERGFVLHCDDKLQQFTTVASYKISDSDEQALISKTICRRAVETASLLTIADSQNDSRFDGAVSLLSAYKPRSIVCGALRWQDEALGVLYLDWPATVAGIPASTERLVDTVTGFAAELLGSMRARDELVMARSRIHALQAVSPSSDALVTGTSRADKQMAEHIAAAAAQDITVLITGETGTGKEMVAKELHRASPRRHGAFVPVHCAALAREIMEAELFGVKKGAFTGADEDRMGRFELASGGTVFLDEVGDIPPDIQVKLLRVLQERTITRLGCSKVRKLDFRLVCATNVDLEAAVADGSFRQDLYYRINVFRIELPPLRDRGDTVVKLAEHFLRHFAGRYNRRQITGLSQAAADLIQQYDWPGNIRELRNAIERAVVIERGNEVSTASLPVGTVAVSSTGSMDEFLDSLPNDYDQARDEFDRLFFRRHLDRNDGNQRAVARETNIARNTLARRLKKIGLV